MIRYSLLLFMCILWSGEVPVFVDKKKMEAKEHYKPFLRLPIKIF